MGNWTGGITKNKHGITARVPVLKGRAIRKYFGLTKYGNALIANQHALKWQDDVGQSIWGELWDSVKENGRPVNTASIIQLEHCVLDIVRLKQDKSGYIFYERYIRVSYIEEVDGISRYRQKTFNYVLNKTRKDNRTRSEAVEEALKFKQIKNEECDCV